MKKLERKLIGEKVLNTINNLDEFVILMSRTVKGKYTGEIEDGDAFIERYNLYKEHLEKNVPEFSLEELLKIYQHFDKIKDNLFSFSEFERFQQCLEFEFLKEEYYELKLDENRTDEQIIEDSYYRLLGSGMLWEYHPEFTGIFIEDKEKCSGFFKNKYTIIDGNVHFTELTKRRSNHWSYIVE